MFIRAFIVAFSLLSAAAVAADYRPYANGRFGYVFEVCSVDDGHFEIVGFWKAEDAA